MIRTLLSTLFFIITSTGLSGCKFGGEGFGISSLSNLNSGGSSQSTAAASEGHEHGNGGDHLAIANSGWFANKALDVKYCIQVDPRFGVDSTTLKPTIVNVISKWKSILVRYQAQSFAFLSTNYLYQESCTDVDLRFLLGTEEGHRTNEEVGYAFREKFFPDTNWSRGFIWLSQSKVNWRDNFRLEGALLHLVGQVLGFQEISETIMDKNWKSWILDSLTPALEQRLTQIDFAAPLWIGPSDLVKISDGADLDLRAATLRLGSQTFQYVIAHNSNIDRAVAHQALYQQKIPGVSKKILRPVYQNFGPRVMIIRLLNRPVERLLLVEISRSGSKIHWLNRGDLIPIENGVLPQGF